MRVWSTSLCWLMEEHAEQARDIEDKSIEWQ